MTVHTREWGEGEPVIALHPLALESSAFEGMGRAFGARGMRTIAVDLPGFGRSPAPDARLTPARLADPVIDLASQLDSPPAVIGISMGGRVALEAVLRAPEAFRSAVMIAPYLPWRRFRGALRMGRFLSPRAAEKLPLETIWPLLKWLASTVERTPYLQDDHVAQAGVRMVYYAACPATRGSIISAAREMALDPAYGERGLWTRLPELRVPCAFMWGERDRLVPASFARHVREALPEAGQILVPCLGHAINGPHGRCLARAVASALDALHSGSEARSADRAASAEPDEVDFVIASCSVESQEAPAPIPRAAS